MNALGIELIGKDITGFFQRATLETIREREEKGIVRQDIINLLMQAKKGKTVHSNNVEEKLIDGFAAVQESDIGRSDVNRVWDDDDLAAQAFIFFFAGFDTVR